MLGWRAQPIADTIVDGAENLFHEGLVRRR